MRLLKRIKSVAVRLFVVLFMVFFTFSTITVYAQSTTERKPIDMILVVDNSCSMFPRDKIVSGCEVWGNDPDFLRIIGVDLFVARLGFAEANALEYQAGVISLGREPTLVSPLQPLNEVARDEIARLVNDPDPALGTNMIAAIELAYQELRTSPARRSTNLPAVVLMTDGRPYPTAGQSDTEIEQLVSANPDIPFFIMLLQDPSDSDYERYVRFWERMQTRYDHIFTYRITDRSQIDNTYNQVIAQLQNTVPEDGGTEVIPDMPYEFFVSKCVQEIVITVQHEPGYTKGTITVQDPRLDTVTLDATPGVRRFRGVDNPVEVISIGASRLTDDLKDDFWAITSDKPVKVYLDRRGAYSINFDTPEVTLTDIANVYLATNRHTPSREFVMRFKLSSDCYGSEPQPIWGDVITPDGQQMPLLVPDDIAPDSHGIYEVRFDFASTYPDILDAPGRFIFILNAGSTLAPDDTTGTRIPIATARLIVDVGRAPYFSDVSPETVVCDGSGGAELSVTVGDYELAVPPTSIHIRAIAAGQQVDLALSTSPDVFTGNVDALCTALSSGATCSTVLDTSLRLRLAAQMVSGPMPPAEYDLPAQVVAPPCTPTPTPLPPTPTPTPTPCPDRDGDGLNDCGVDQCPDAPGIQQLQGCPWWPYALGGLFALLLLFAVFKWVIPWIKVRTCCPPPKAFVLICQQGRPSGVKGTYGIGLAKLTNRITIGSDRKKAHIHVSGLKPIEFYIIGKGEQVQIFDAATDTPKGTFKTIPSDVSTSNIEVKLRIGLDNSKLNRC